jgi:hypothetical protein
MGILSKSGSDYINALAVISKHRSNTYHPLGTLTVGSGTTSFLVGSNLYLTPVVHFETFSINSIGALVSASIASTGFYIGIYDDVDGTPVNLLYTSTLLSSATTGYKSDTCNFTFEKNVVYWIGVCRDAVAGNVNFRPYNLNSTSPIGQTTVPTVGGIKMGLTKGSTSSFPSTLSGLSEIIGTTGLPAIVGYVV